MAYYKFISTYMAYYKFISTKSYLLSPQEGLVVATASTHMLICCLFFPYCRAAIAKK